MKGESVVHKVLKELATSQMKNTQKEKERGRANYIVNSVFDAWILSDVSAVTFTVAQYKTKRFIEFIYCIKLPNKCTYVHFLVQKKDYSL